LYSLGLKGVQVFQRLLRLWFDSNKFDDTKTAPFLGEDFLEFVLVPELALRLAMKMLSINEEDGVKTLAISTDFGMSFHGSYDEDDCAVLRWLNEQLVAKGKVDMASQKPASPEPEAEPEVPVKESRSRRTGPGRKRSKRSG
jgi:hypothetical protein